MHAHVRPKKNKHVESEQLVNRVPTSLYTSFVSVDFQKNMPDSYAAFGCRNQRSTTSLQFYGIPTFSETIPILKKE